MQTHKEREKIDEVKNIVSMNLINIIHLIFHSFTLKWEKMMKLKIFEPNPVDDFNGKNNKNFFAL